MEEAKLKFLQMTSCLNIIPVLLVVFFLLFSESWYCKNPGYLFTPGQKLGVWVIFSLTRIDETDSIVMLLQIVCLLPRTIHVWHIFLLLVDF